MKFRADKDVFSKAFAACAAAVNTRSPKDILLNVHLEVKDGVASLSATDTDTSIIVKTEVESVADGEALVPQDRMLAIMRETVDDSIELETSGNAVRVSSGRAAFDIETANPDEFPKPAPIDSAKEVKVPVESLQRAIRQTAFATDVDSARYALGGVRIESDGQNIAMIGTDGRRLSVVKFAEATEEWACIVPVHAATIIQRAKLDGDVGIVSDTNHFQMASYHYTIICRQIEGRYPSWRQVIPADYQQRSRAAIAADMLDRAIRQAAIVADKESRGIDFTFTEGKLSLSAKAQSRGSAKIESAMEYSGASLTTKLDYKFVSDFVRSVDQSEMLAIYFLTPKDSVVFDDCKGGTYVVMPMAVL